ncbi:MAG: c-type cytochrome biogenesis protein CcsB [Thermodesulfovibrio sp.]|nr:c-type cytochrome biogenesis protein CcsB [Thermodesulfovibrio sp.]MDW7972122.1 c-type cytochrome biogenesis protein CcsB [Thermodesulfovibrio sp.]
MSYQIISIAGLLYIVAMPIYIVYLLTKNNKVGYAATSTLALGAFIQIYGFFQRFKEMYAINHSIMRSIPITNLYESLVFFALCLVVGYLIIEWKYKRKSLGVFVSIITGITIGLTDVLGITKEVQPLVPALKSNWLLVHVTLSFIAYAAFGISFVTALLHIIMESQTKKSFKYIFSTTLLGFMLFMFISIVLDIITADNPKTVKIFHSTLGNSSIFISIISWTILGALIFIVWRFGHILSKILHSLKIDSNFLENITYKGIAFGFPIFTIGGLVFGAIWADQAWGRYWGWDPKETWSLITWFVYAFYLHAKFIRGWRGTKTSVIAVIGFIVTIFTYLGVNLFLSGLHSYGSM